MFIIFLRMKQELIQQEQEEEDIQMDIPVCGGNLETPVADQACYVTEVHYQVGSLKYIENAD